MMFHMISQKTQDRKKPDRLKIWGTRARHDRNCVQCATACHFAPKSGVLDSDRDHSGVVRFLSLFDLGSAPLCHAILSKNLWYGPDPCRALDDHRWVPGPPIREHFVWALW